MSMERGLGDHQDLKTNLHVGAAAVFAVAAAILIWNCAPGILWHDTGEFSAVGWRLSLSHPPGHPLHAMATHMGLRLIPFGELAFRSNVVSALCVSGSLAGLFILMRLWIDGLNPWVAGVLSLMPLGVTACVEQAVRSEVYGLQLLLSVGLAHACLSVSARQDQRSLIILSALFGLAGANHSYLGLFWIPIALVAMFVGRVGWRGVLGAAFAGLTTLMTYVYVYLRGFKGGEVGWGEPRNWTELWTIISGKEWIKSLAVGEEYPPLSENIPALLGYVVDQLSPGLFAVIVLVIVLAVPRWVEQRRWGVLTIGVVIAIPFASRAPYGVDLHNPDLGGYVASSFLAISFLVAQASTAIPTRLRQHGQLGLVLGVLVFVSVRVPGETNQDRSAIRYAHEVLKEVPPDGTLVLSDYSTQFGLWSLRALEGQRPDVALVFRGQVNVDWYGRRLVKSHPRAADRLFGFPLSYDAPSTRWEPGVRFESLGPLALSLVPSGLTLERTSFWPPVSAHASKFQVFDGAGFSGRRFAALHHAFMIEQILRLAGPKSLAAWHMAQLRRLAPGDAWTVALDVKVSEYSKPTER